MGIKGLSTYLKHNIVDSACEVKLSTLAGLRVAVDASIYMYRGKVQGDVISSVYALVSTLQFHNLELIFVFDGIPPEEKKSTLAGRRAKKKTAQKELARLEKRNLHSDDHQVALRIQRLKRECATLSETDLTDVKNLLAHMGIKYVEANGEAELLCAQLERDGVVDACMSDDTDVFAYGCSTILRYVSVLGESAVVYDTDAVIRELGLEYTTFRDICAVAGTDYSKCHRGFAVAMQLYLEWCNSISGIEFHEWINDKELPRISELYNLNTYQNTLPAIESPEGDYEKLRKLLSNHGFIFV